MEPGLFGIELPWMHVEHDGAPLARVDAGECSVDERDGEEPEESAAQRQVHAGEARGADGHLPEVDAVDVLRDVRKARRVGKAVTVVDHRIHRRVVDEAFLDQHAEGPRRVAPDGVIGRAIAAHETAGRLLDGVLRAPHVGTEARGAEPEHRRVIPAVAGDLVPTLDDLAHEPWIALSDDSEDEERAARAVRVEQIEQALGLREHAAGQAAETVDAKGRFELVPVVVLLDVDGQCVDDRLRQPGLRAAAARAATMSARHRRS